MKKTSTLVVSSLVILLLLLVSGCSHKYPPFPEGIKYHFVVKVRGQSLNHTLLKNVSNPQALVETAETPQVRCLVFEIVSVHPYQLKYLYEAALTGCNSVGGYRAEETVLFLNWVEDMIAWAESKL